MTSPRHPGCAPVAGDHEVSVAACAEELKAISVEKEQAASQAEADAKRAEVSKKEAAARNAAAAAEQPKLVERTPVSTEFHVAEDKLQH